MSSSSKQPTKKRARGLAAAASSSKRSKRTEEVEEEQGIENAAETWADLKELWENAFDAFSGEDPATAAPLLRGLIFECDRIVRNSVDALHPLQTAGTTTLAASPSGGDEDEVGITLERFYLIYGTSVYALGQLIYLSAELALSSEPAPEAFFGKALDLLLTSPSQTTAEHDETPWLDRLTDAHSNDWKLQLARARSVFGLLAAAGSAEDEVVAEEQVGSLLSWAKSTTDSALTQVAKLPLPDTPAEGELAPPAQRDPATTFLPSPPTADQRLSLILAAARSVAGIVEALPSTEQAEAARWTEGHFGQVEQATTRLASSSERDAWRIKALVGRGGVRLALGAAQAEQVVEADTGKEDKAFKAAVEQLRSALKDLSAARSLCPRMASTGPALVTDGQGETADEKDEDEDEIAALTVETCLTLIGLYESLGEDAGKEADIEALETQARTEGWEGYGEDADESEQDDI